MELCKTGLPALPWRLFLEVRTRRPFRRRLTLDIFLLYACAFLDGHQDRIDLLDMLIQQLLELYPKSASFVLHTSGTHTTHLLHLNRMPLELPFLYTGLMGLPQLLPRFLRLLHCSRGNGFACVNCRFRNGYPDGPFIDALRDNAR